MDDIGINNRMATKNGGEPQRPDPRATAPRRRARMMPSALCALLSLAGAALAQEGDAEKAAAALLIPPAERAVERGLKWLAASQHENGSFGTGMYRGNAAVCALAGMAFMSNGSVPDRGPYGKPLSRCLDYLLENVRASGFIASGDAGHAPMYGHGFATMFLAECHGMSPRADLREKLTKAVRVIVNSQNQDGGWRYQPVRADADISVTVCEIMALRAARNAGLFVPSETIDRSLEYVKRSQNADGGFMYMLQGGESAFPRSAAAVVALYSAGIYEGRELVRGLDYVMQFLPDKNANRREGYYFYGHYYAAQAAWQAGGDRWRRWYPAIRDELVAQQRSEGFWVAPEGNECATAMACIILQIPNNCLPIFQR